LGSADRSLTARSGTKHITDLYRMIHALNASSALTLLMMFPWLMI